MIMHLAHGTMVTANIRLDRLLGTGGMGSVWAADHLTLETQVAVKFISAEALGSKGSAALARFKREAKAAAKIRSPHAVQIFDQGVTEDGTPYIVMELLQGESLGAHLKRLGTLDLQTAAQVLHQVCKALATAGWRRST